MRKYVLTACAAGITALSYGQILFDRSAGSYTAGDLNGQNNWTVLQQFDTNAVPQLGTDAFTVDNSSWLINDSVSDTAFLVTTNGSYIYLDEISAGNELYSEWSGEMDFSFSIPQGTYAGNGTMPNANFFTIGLTSSTTNGLSQGDQNDAVLFLRYRANNRLDMQLCSEQDADLRIFQTPSDGDTWVEPAGQEILGMNPQAGDCQSDELHLSWTIRKTTDGNYLAWGSVSNKNTGAWVDDVRTNGLGGRVVSTEGKNKSSAVYNSTDPVLAMGRHVDAYSSNYAVYGNGLLDMDIENLTVIKSIVSPELTAPTNLVVLPYDAQATLIWDAVTEASSYDVFRSTVSGSYGVAFTNLTGTNLVDSGLINNTEYFYAVQAVYDGFGNSTNSLEVAATPTEIFGGTILDTSFTSAEGYSDGDLAGQQGWVAAANSDPNAFNIVNAASTGEASTIGNGFMDTNYIGNAVYLDKLMDNNADDTLEGSIEFKVQSYLAEGQTVATLLNADIFSFGLTSAEDEAHVAWDSKKALMLVRLAADGNVAVLFTTETADNSTKLAELQREDLSWDPEDEEADGVTSDDLMTETITLDWSIRKTRESGVYQAKATLSSLTATNTSLAYYVSSGKQNMYDSSTSKFTMSHYRNAWKTNGTLTNKADVVLESLSVVQTNYPPEVTAPIDVATVGGDRSVTVSWPATLEATSYDILFAESAGGDQVELATITDIIYLDSPRFNGVTNWYTIRANFDAGSAESDEVAGAPFASVTVLEFDGVNLDMGSADVNFSLTDGLTTNGSLVYIDNTVTPLISSSEYNGPTFYAYTLLDSLAADITDGRGSIGYRFDNANGGNGVTTDNFEYRQNGGAPRADLLWYVESTDWAEPTASVDAIANAVDVRIANKLLSSGTFQIAVRNGSTWYVSEDTAGNGTGGEWNTTGTLHIPNIAEANFGELPVIIGSEMGQPSSFDTGANLGFTDINAIGWYSDEQLRVKPVQLTINVSGSVPSIDYWAENNNIENLNEDTDGDKVSNLKEYAFLGDPNDPNDAGTLPELTAAEYMGTNGFIFVNVELRDPAPGIEYSLETTGDLVNQGFAPDAEIVKIGEDNIDYYTKAVTNFVPATAAAKFIDLKISEQ
ncbi:hypothetical protein [Pontiella agarivorans]|uniref:Fibronectin type-III domain-containing protein n=1 Tax=Pontiella agarivorans TaxID=3038953 RepID=A0ABU5MTK6_9BACT|nr:hypothetical protein [Pontiella agarivorans]MDZ8117482.1 hypothetical protein [Pontiella agarivorans]